MSKDKYWIDWNEVIIECFHMTLAILVSQNSETSLMLVLLCTSLRVLFIFVCLFLQVIKPDTRDSRYFCFTNQSDDKSRSWISVSRLLRNRKKRILLSTPLVQSGKIVRLIRDYALQNCEYIDNILDCIRFLKLL